MVGKVTIKDIAKLVGVSTTTISHYINGNYAKMSEKTKAKIQHTIDVTGYQPSAVAKGLATNDYKMIGVVIADITNPFISSVMKGVHDACREAGYNVNFTNSDNDITMEIENINRLRQQNVSGIILDSVSADNPVIKTLDNRRTVMIDRQSKKVNIDTVVSDNDVSTYTFTKEMCKLGYESIYFVSRPMQEISTRMQRYDGFKRAVGVHDDSRLLIVDNKEKFKDQLQQIMEANRSKIGFFTMNGPTLLEFMEQMDSLNYRYPQDYGVGSYEDLDWMKVLRPGISCIRQDSHKIGYTAATQLLKKLQQLKSTPTETPKPKTIEVFTEIIMRGSL